MVKQERIGSIDVLRILSMLMIVVLHVLGHGDILSSAEPLTSKWFIVSGLEAMCIIGVNCFALITGFVNWNKKFKLKNILNLWLQVFFYSFVIAIIFYALNLEEFSVKALIGFALPVASRKYWYFTAYFLLFISMPFINMVVEKMDKKASIISIISNGFIFCVYAFLAMSIGGDIFGLASGYSFIWLAFLYFVGALIKKHDLGIFIKGKELRSWVYLLLYFVFTLGNMVSGFVISWMKDFGSPAVIYNYSFLFNFLSSISLLMFFKNIKIKGNWFINTLAKTSFGVYLVHEHLFIRKYFMTDKFAGLLNYNVFLMILLILVFVIAIYLICTIIEYLRQLLFSLCRIHRLTAKIDEKIMKNFQK